MIYGNIACTMRCNQFYVCIVEILKHVIELAQAQPHMQHILLYIDVGT